MDHITAHDPSDYIEYEGPRELSPDEEREAQLGHLRDEASMSRRKAVAIVSLLDGLPLSQLTVPTERMLLEWHVQSLFDEAKRADNRIAELETPRAARKESLKAEFKTLQKTWLMQHEGLEKITERQSEIEAELDELEVAI